MNSANTGLLIIGGAVLLVLIFALILYYNNLYHEIQYVQMEMERAENRHEREHWRKRLTALRWRFLLCFNPLLLRRLFRRRSKYRLSDEDELENADLLPISEENPGHHQEHHRPSAPAESVADLLIPSESARRKPHRHRKHRHRHYTPRH